MDYSIQKNFRDVTT